MTLEYKIDSETSCWIFQGDTDPSGYGIVWERKDGRKAYVGMAHRIAYEQSIGHIPDGWHVDHVCFTRRCVNPDHLRVLSAEDNRSRQRSALKTHCLNGHEFTPDNTYLRPRRYREGVRDCRACIRERARKYAAKKRAEASA